MNNHLFSTDTDWQNNACLSWSRDPIGLYINGYKEAADTLVNKVIESSNDQDILVYPIAFLYRQYIELQLKNIIRGLKLLLKDGSGFPKHHNIQLLWHVANELREKIISKLDKSVEEYITRQDIKIIDGVINDFVKVDQESFAFRYPEDKKGNKNLKGVTHVNLRKLGQQIAVLAKKIDKFNLVSFPPP